MAKFFSLYEFVKSQTADKNGIDNIPNFIEVDNLKLLAEQVLDPIRLKWGSGISVTSGYRCERLNDIVGGSNTSQHLSGQAADIVARNGDNKGLWDLIIDMINNKEICAGQVIWEKGNKKNPDWIHISTPSQKHINEIKYIL